MAQEDDDAAGDAARKRARFLLLNEIAHNTALDVRSLIANNHDDLFTISVDENAVSQVNEFYWDTVEKIKIENQYPQDKRINRPKIAALLIYAILTSGERIFTPKSTHGERYLDACYMCLCNLVMMAVLNVGKEEISRKHEKDARYASFQRLRNEPAPPTVVIYLLCAYMETYASRVG